MRDIFSEEVAARFDHKGVRKAYDAWPELARMGSEAAPDVSFGKVERVYFLGMGGSAAGGEIAAGWLWRRHGAAVGVFKGEIPPVDMRGSLAIACSVSGQTEETISMLGTAVQRGASAVSVSSGGKLEELSRKLGATHIGAPAALAPRYLLPYITFACIAIATDALGIDASSEVQDALSGMTAESEAIRVGTPQESNPSKEIAFRLLERTPATYGTAATKGVGVRFKSILNENAKKHAYFDVIPEIFHNEIEAWERPDTDFLPVFLRHSLDGERERRLTDRMIMMLNDLDVQPLEVKGRGGSSLAELATMVYRLDLAAYYVAVGLHIDPLPTRLLDALKK